MTTRTETGIAFGAPSTRKPLNDTAGYVCQRKCKLGGYVMIIDRSNGGDWIDAEDRWVVMHCPIGPEGQIQMGRFVCGRSLPQAREVMKHVALAETRDEAAEAADILPEIPKRYTDDGELIEEAVTA